MEQVHERPSQLMDCGKSWGGLHEAERPDCRNQNVTAPILSDFDLKANQPDRSPQATGFVPDVIVIRLQPNSSLTRSRNKRFKNTVLLRDRVCSPHLPTEKANAVEREKIYPIKKVR